ncbi:MAG: hypothetical protein ACI9WU_002929 [Myxococcota bacterium]|jgi:hypothetical protein
MSTTQTLIMAMAFALGLNGCSADEGDVPVETTEATIGPAGGALEGSVETPFEGVHIQVPAGALAAETVLILSTATDDTPLPEGAHAVGTQFTLEGIDVSLGLPIRVTMPVDTTRVDDFGQDFTMVKVWLRDPQGWKKLDAVETGIGWVTVETDSLSTLAPGIKLETETP